PQRQELPAPRTRPRRHTRRSGSVAPRLRLNGGSPLNALSSTNHAVGAERSENRGHRSPAHALAATDPTSSPPSAGAPFDCGNRCTFRLRLTLADSETSSSIASRLACARAATRERGENLPLAMG